MRHSRGPARPALSALGAGMVAAMALAACGGGSGGASHSDVKLATVTASTTQNAFQEMADGSASAAQQKGVSLKQQAPNGVDPTTEAQMFQAATHTSSDGIAYMTTSPNTFVNPTKQATQQSVPVVAMDAAPVPGSGVNTLVANDNVALGASVAQQILQKIPSGQKGEVVIGNDIPGLPLLDARVNGMINVIKSQRPDITISGPYNVGSEPADNYNHWSALVRAHPNALAYLEPGDQGGVSFKQITEQTGKHYLVGACDVDPTALQAVKQGDVYVLGDPYHFLKGYIATTLLAEKAIDNKPLPSGWWNSGAGIVTQSNVNQVIAREKDNSTRYAFFKNMIQQELAHPSVKPLSQAA